MSIPILASFLLALAAVAFVALPLVRREEIADNDTFAIVDPKLEDLLFSREVTYAAIKDLAFERDMGKLSEEDFAQLDHQYRARAVDILQELEQVEQVTTDDELERWIEEAVRSARQEGTSQKPAGHSDRKPRRRSGKRKQVSAAQTCSSCDRPYIVGDRFCSGCGSALRQICAACGGTSDPDVHFCTQCGTELAST